MIKLCDSLHLGMPLCNSSNKEQTGTSIALRVMACALGILATTAGIAILVGVPFLAATPLAVAYALMAGGPALVILSLCLSSIRSTSHHHVAHAHVPPNNQATNLRIQAFQDAQKECSVATKDTSSTVNLDTFQAMQTKSFVYNSKLSPILNGAQRFETTFMVVEQDALNVLVTYKDDNPVGLNMANRYTPGGGVALGASAQEEELCRRTTLYPALKNHADNKEYPIPVDGGIYTPQVQIFKKDITSNYEQMNSPVEVAIVSVAGYDLRKLNYSKDFQSLYKEEYLKGTKIKIRNMLRVVHHQGHTTLVLGALGCGVFANSPTDVAQYFQEVFEEDEFKGSFERVIFAILNKSDCDAENVAAFAKMCAKFDSAS